MVENRLLVQDLETKLKEMTTKDGLIRVCCVCNHGLTDEYKEVYLSEGQQVAIQYLSKYEPDKYKLTHTYCKGCKEEALKEYQQPKKSRPTGFGQV